MRTIGGAETTRNVLLDANNLIYRAYFSFVEGRKKDGLKPMITRLPSKAAPERMLEMDVGVVQGSVKIFADWLYDIQSPTRISVFFDGLPLRRTAIFPDYKKRDKEEAKRAVHIESPDSAEPAVLRDGTEVYGPVSALAHIFRLLGCDVYHHPGEEADDLIASFVKKHSDAVNIIMSSDKDFFQLVGGRTVVYRPGPKTPRLLDAERVEEAMEQLYKVRVKPSEIRMFKALTGDSSDKIVGIMGLRKKSAHPMCRFSSVDEVYASGMESFSAGERAKALLMKERIELNYGLVGFYDDLDLSACLRPEAGDFPLAGEVMRKDLSLIDVDMRPYRIGKYTPQAIPLVPDWLA